MEIEWKKLKDLASKKFDDLHNVPGIYFVRWAKDGKPASISRLEGVDYKGILYIGSAKKLRKRVRQLWKAISKYRARIHTVAKTIIFCKVFEIISLDEYEVSWEELKTHRDAVGQEWAAIRSYATKYREPPPLNLGIRREYFAIGGITRGGEIRIAHKADKFVRFIVGS